MDHAKRIAAQEAARVAPKETRGAVILFAICVIIALVLFGGYVKQNMHNADMATKKEIVRINDACAKDAHSKECAYLDAVYQQQQR